MSTLPLHLVAGAPMVGDIVERHVKVEAGPIATTFCSSPSSLPSPGSCGSGTACVSPADTARTTTGRLRPIQATVGQPFPVMRARHSYARAAPIRGECCDVSRSTREVVVEGVVARATSLFLAKGASGFSAHVQPQDGTSCISDLQYREVPPSLRCAHPRVRDGEVVPVLTAGSSVQRDLPAHQWTAADFDDLRSGFYRNRLIIADASMESTATAIGDQGDKRGPPSSSPISGEAFFSLLFQCMRSTIRKHQQLALEVLMAHLRGLSYPAAAGGSAQQHAREEAEALRDRCVHGPNCGPFLFFVVEILASAGHPAMIELAAACLVLLLRGLTRGEPLKKGVGSAVEVAFGTCNAALTLLDAIGEMGSPTGGDANEDDDEGEVNGEADVRESGGRREEVGLEGAADDVDLPFSEVSEMLRGPEARIGLEHLGFTNKVLAAMRLLLHKGDGDTIGVPPSASQGDTETIVPATRPPASPTALHEGTSTAAEILFVELLMCGGVGIGNRATCRRLAEDPYFLSWVEAQLSAVVLGHRKLEETVELLCMLQRVAQCPAALRSLLRGLPDAALRQDDLTSGARPPLSVSRDAATSNKTADAALHAHLSLHAQQKQQRRKFYETWLLFFLFVCSTNGEEVRTVRAASAILWSMLLLRRCARLGNRRGGGHDGYALVQDLSDTLLTNGMQLGAGLVLEVWLLEYCRSVADGTAVTPSSISTYFQDAARAALQQVCAPVVHASTTMTVMAPTEAAAPNVSCAEAQCSTEKDATHQSGETITMAQRMVREFRRVAGAHYFATYIGEMARLSPATCDTLCGSDAQTQQEMKRVVASIVMDPDRLRGAFARITSPLLSRSSRVAVASSVMLGASTALDGDGGGGGERSPMGVAAAIRSIEHRWLHQGGSIVATFAESASSAGIMRRNDTFLLLSFDAASLYANTRVVAAVARTYPSIAGDMVSGYASMLVHGFVEACLRIRDEVGARLQVDELCTMSEAVQLLQRHSGERAAAAVAGEEDVVDSDMAVAELYGVRSGAPATCRYEREARVGAFFLLHGIALSKHCLDVVPILVPLLQLDWRVGMTPTPTTAAATQLSLMGSLQEGVEHTPVPAMVGSDGGVDRFMASSPVSTAPSSTSSTSFPAAAAAVAVSGAPRSWVLYPLFDSFFSAKHVWAQWLRGLLGLHARVKEVLGWDALLSHTLLWVVAHRGRLWGDATATPTTRVDGKAAAAAADAEEEEATIVEREGSIDASSGPALCTLLMELCAILHTETDSTAHAIRAGEYCGGLSAAASRTLEIALTAYGDVPSEEGLPLLLHALLAYVAAHGSANAVLAVLQVLLSTPILPSSAAQTTLPLPLTKSTKDDLLSPYPSTSRGSDVLWDPSTVQALRWLYLWRLAPAGPAQGVGAVSWSLDSMVALAQLVGPSLRHGVRQHCLDAPMDAAWMSRVSCDPLTCVRLLTDGCCRRYLQQRAATHGGLTRMEKIVLRSTLEELDWRPAVLWSQVED